MAAGQFVIHNDTDFAVIHREHLRERDMSLRSKGLLTLLLSLPRDWDFSVAGLVALSKDGKDAVLASLEELKDFGYLLIEKGREGGRFTSKYHIYDRPNFTGEDSPSRNDRVGNTESVNPPQYKNNNIADKQSTYNDEDNSSSRINTSKNNISSMGEKKTKKEIDLSFVGIEYLDAMERWIAFHKEIGKPYTKTGVEGAYRRLLMLSNQDARVADQIVEQSIANGWQGLFELKQSKQSNYGNNSNQASGGFFCQLADSLKGTGGIH